jgi:hypothetical protein
MILESLEHLNQIELISFQSNSYHLYQLRLCIIAFHIIEEEDIC